jgi:adenosylcobinamide-phosphate synthase
MNDPTPTVLYTLLPVAAGWMADRIWGDPPGLPHPVVGFGRLIAWGEKRWNAGRRRTAKGACLATALIAATLLASHAALKGLEAIHPALSAVAAGVLVFYCLAGKTLIEEVRQVFAALDVSLDEGRRQVGRIVGRDAGSLSAQEVRTAALETLSENLSDGVVAPLFWLMLLGAPGMCAYKMVNTLDSMIGYKNERYRQFGCWAARIDDAANYIPARLTACLMLLACGRLSLLPFVVTHGRRHSSPNAGYPEAALAGILNCRFGGTNTYFGLPVDKPYIGCNPRTLTSADMHTAVAINRKVEACMLALTLSFIFITS